MSDIMDYSSQAQKAFKNGTLGDFFNDVYLSGTNGDQQALEWINSDDGLMYADILSNVRDSMLNDSIKTQDSYSDDSESLSLEENYISFPTYSVGSNDYSMFLSDNYSTIFTEINSVFDNTVTTMETAVETIKKKVEDLETFAAADPTIAIAIDTSTTNIENCFKQFSNDIKSSRNKLNGVISAIEDYGDGKWSDWKSKGILDNFLSSKFGNGSGFNSSGGSGGRFDFGRDSTGSDIGDDLDDIQDGNGEIGSLPEDSDFDTKTPSTGDEELVIPNVPGSTSNKFGNSSQIIDDDLILNDDEKKLGNQLGNSLSELKDFSGISGAFLIPSPNTGKISGVKSSSVAVPMAITAAAAAALGGKIYYDKSHQDEDDVNAEDVKNEDENTEVIENEDKNAENIENEDKLSKVENDASDSIEQSSRYVSKFVNFKNKLLGDREEN